MVKEQFFANDCWTQDFAADLLERQLDPRYVWVLNLPFSILHLFQEWVEEQHANGCVIIFFMSDTGAG
jgi:hypothetical protein